MARRVAQSIINAIVSDYESGEQERIVRRIRYLARKGARKLLKPGGAQADGPNAKPEGSVMLEAALLYARSEEAIAAIRERQIKSVGPAEALLTALAAPQRTPVTVVFELEDDESSKPKE